MAEPGRPLVAIVMGSQSDLAVMQAARDALTALGIAHEVHVASAHRTPERAAGLARGARERGLRVIIAGAGAAAHLAGVLAAHTTLPVIGVPIAGGSLGGLDAVLSTVQMPSGVPVAAVAINGARNAALLAAQILATADQGLAERLEEMKRQMADEVAAASQRLSQG